MNRIAKGVPETLGYHDFNYSGVTLTGNVNSCFVYLCSFLIRVLLFGLSTFRLVVVA